MGKKVVAVLFGGCSPEHEVSIRSAATVLSGISRDLYDIVPVYITRGGRWLLYDGSIDNFANVQWEKFGTPAILSPDATHHGFLRIVGDKVKIVPVDIIFPVIHGKNGEDGSIQGLCQAAGIPFVGCGVMSSAVSLDKAVTKTLAKQSKIPVAPYLTYYSADIKNGTVSFDEIAKMVRYKTGYPCFVKPVNTGSSVGITKVTKKSELEKAIELAMSYDYKILIEKGITGRELEVAVLGNREVIVSGVGEILPFAEFYDYDAKYVSQDSKTVIDPSLPDGVEEKVRELAARIFKMVDGSGYSRVDFFLEEGTNEVLFNEINTIPGFTSISMYPRLFEAAGYPITKLVSEMIRLGFEREQL